MAYIGKTNWLNTETVVAPDMNRIEQGIIDLDNGKQNVLGFTPVPNTRKVNSKTLNSDITLTQDDVGSGVTNKVFTSTEKSKLLNIAENANEYTHPNHSGDVTSSGDGATVIAVDAVTNTKLANITRGSIKVGGIDNAPTDLNAKTDKQILIGNGTDVVSVAVSGDVTISNLGAVTIGNDKVSNAKLANMPTMTIKGNNTGATADPVDLDKTQAKALLDIDDLETQVNTKAVKVMFTSLTITATWTGASAPYTQEVTVTGITATDKPHITPVYSSVLATAQAQEEAYSMLSKVESGLNKVTFTCLFDKPPVAIPIEIEVIR